MSSRLLEVAAKQRQAASGKENSVGLPVIKLFSSVSPVSKGVSLDELRSLVVARLNIDSSVAARVSVIQVRTWDDNEESKCASCRSACWCACLLTRVGCPNLA